MTYFKLLFVVSILFGLSACENPLKRAVRSAQYSAYEMVRICSKNEKKEIKTMETTSLKERSRATLKSTQNRYAQMHSALKASESKLDPVIHQLRDQVLYLKHNLNAAAIGSLKGEGTRIQNEVEGLISKMNKSISSADQFIADMKQTE